MAIIMTAVEKGGAVWAAEHVPLEAVGAEEVGRVEGAGERLFC